MLAKPRVPRRAWHEERAIDAHSRDDTGGDQLVHPVGRDPELGRNIPSPQERWLGHSGFPFVAVRVRRCQILPSTVPLPTHGRSNGKVEGTQVGDRGRTETEVRHRLQRQLRLGDEELGWLWSQLSKDDPQLIPNAVHEGLPEQADLLHAAQRLLAVGRSFPAAGRRARANGAGIGADGGPQRSRTETTELPLVMGALTPYEHRRTWVVSQALAHDAKQQDNVLRFRVEVVGRPLLYDEARAFVASPANAIFTTDELRSSGIPIVGHHAVLCSVHRHDDVLRTEVMFEPSGQRLAAKLHGVSQRDELRRVGVPAGDRVEMFEVWPTSILDHLVVLSQWLADRYGWLEPLATLFVLTGVPPIRWPVRTWEGNSTPAGVPPRRVVALEAEPWVSARTVATVYRGLQRRVLGGTNQQLGEKGLAVFKFVFDSLESAHGRPPFRQLAQEWNQRHQATRPEWVYQNLDMLSRDFNRATEALLSPKYRDARRPAPPDGTQFTES